MAAKPILIFGDVKDDKGNPIPEARVSFVAGPVPLIDIAALTDNKGSFVLSAPVVGEYTIEVVSEGFVPKRVQISASGPERHIEIRLLRNEL